MTDSAGKQTTINLNSSGVKTVADVLKVINDTSVGVEAKLNETGDGIVLIDTSGGSGNLTIEDTNNGNAALDLGIRGTSKTVTVEAVERKQIEGSQNFRLTLNSTDKLSDVVKKINDSEGPLTASVLTSGPDSVRLLFSSRASGEIGRVHVDGDAVGLTVNTTTNARDAVIAVGSQADEGGILVKSSSDTFDRAIQGLTLTVAKTSTSAVQVSVNKTTNSIERSIQGFVDQVNKVVDKLKKDASFDPVAKSAGLLFGSSEVIRLQQNIGQLVNGRIIGTGSIQSLAQLGISLNGEGKLEFDKERFAKRVETNATDVEEFFTKKDVGFSARAKLMLENMVGDRKGALIVRSQTLSRRVEESQKRVGFLEIRLTAERTKLEKQFFAMEEAISKIRSNTSAVSGIQNLFNTST